MPESRVEVWRGALVESVHAVTVAVVDAGGALRAFAGEAERVTYARSAAKPFQALPIVRDGAFERFGLSGRELAVCIASHSGEPHHVAAVRSVLRKIDESEDALACGPHPPFDKTAAQALRGAGESPGRVHNNCSGKHAGMLALARVHGWPAADYQRREHPVQRRVLREIARWAGVDVDEMPTAVDGCGVATAAVPLSALAAAFARLAATAREGRAAPERIVRAMTEHPEYVAGSGRLCTDLMRAAGGRIIAKVGAEGVYCAGVPGAELGVALKVEDGSRRAAGPALIAVLKALGLLSDDEVAGLADHAESTLTNTRGEEVGRIRAAIRLEAADAAAG